MQQSSPRALVTGGALRVGRSIVLALARHGYDVAVHYRASEQPARELANEVRAIGRNSQVFHSDLSLAGGVETLTTEVAADFGPIDLLVLSASNYAKEPFLDITPEGFAETLQVNLLAPFFLAQKFGAQMMARGHGQIVTLLDWSLDRPDPNYLAYQVSKAGLREATLGLARALAPVVRVNGVAPGAVLLPEETSDERREAVRQKTLVGHLGTPEDVARAVIYLIEAEHFVTGSILRVDGGRSLL
jgi:pteridine reductase